MRRQEEFESDDEALLFLLLLLIFLLFPLHPSCLSHPHLLQINIFLPSPSPSPQDMAEADEKVRRVEMEKEQIQREAKSSEAARHEVRGLKDQVSRLEKENRDLRKELEAFDVVRRWSQETPGRHPSFFLLIVVSFPQFLVFLCLLLSSFVSSPLSSLSLSSYSSTPHPLFLPPASRSSSRRLRI